MAHAQKPDFVIRPNGRVHLNRLGRQFSRLLAAEVCASAVVMLDTPCCEVVRRVLATHSIRQSPLHFPSHASPCAITFQLDSTYFTLSDHSKTCLMASAFNACLFDITDQSNDFRRCLSAGCNVELSIKSSLYTKCTTLIS